MTKSDACDRAACPKCQTIADSRDAVEVLFGFRKNQRYTQPQSWCRRCRKGLLPLGAFPFKTVLADPPWSYNVSRGLKGVADDEYETMPTGEICKMPVEAVTASNAVLLLWATNPLLPDALRVMESWGFEYKTKMTWCKNNLGVGSWLRGQTEDLLIGVRGKPTRPAVAPSSVLHADNPGHSQKPRAFYPIAERLGDAPRLELFARQRRRGWESFGNELSPTVETSILEALA